MSAAAFSLQGANVFSHELAQAGHSGVRGSPVFERVNGNGALRDLSFVVSGLSLGVCVAPLIRRLTDEIDAFLSEAEIPIRLGVLLASGYPMVVSVWYLWNGEEFICATPENAPLAKALKSSLKCGFEVSNDNPPYFGIRGQADVTLVPDPSKTHLQMLADRYLKDRDPGLAKWLMEKPGQELCLRIKPHRMMSYDYRNRMAASETA